MDLDGLLVGNDRAWADLVRNYGGRLMRFLRSRINDRHAAEDVLQEIWIQVQRSLERFDRTRPFGAWLFTIAAHRATDYFKAQYRHQAEPLDRDVSGREPEPAQLAAQRERDPAGPAAKLDRAIHHCRMRYLAAGRWDELAVFDAIAIDHDPDNRRIGGLVGWTDAKVANFRFSTIKRLARLVRDPRPLRPRARPTVREPQETYRSVFSAVVCVVPAQLGTTTCLFGCSEMPTIDSPKSTVLKSSPTAR